MKANIEKVLSFLIELARLFLAWKKGVRGTGYGVRGGEKMAKAESKNPETGRKGTGYGVQGTGGRKPSETESKNPESGGKKGQNAERRSPRTPSPVPRTPKGLFSAHDANSAVPGGDGNSAGSNRGAAVATGEVGDGEWGIVNGEEKNLLPTNPHPLTPIPQDVSPRTPYPVPRTPLNILGWGLMLYAGLRLLSRL